MGRVDALPERAALPDSSSLSDELFQRPGRHPRKRSVWAPGLR
jgi:hypothetical protein